MKVTVVYSYSDEEITEVRKDSKTVVLKEYVTSVMEQGDMSKYDAEQIVDDTYSIQEFKIK